jgi:hypothetical protein
MADSVEAVGIGSPHRGHRFSAPKKPLSLKEGGVNRLSWSQVGQRAEQ